MEFKPLSIPQFALDGRVFAAKVALYFGLLGVGVWLALLETLLFSTISILVLGATFAHGVELLHQALHNTGFRSKSSNRIAGFFLGLPMLVSFSEYQRTHLRHHRTVGTPVDEESFDYDFNALGRPMGFALHLFMIRHYMRKARRLVEALGPLTSFDTRARQIQTEYRLMGAVVAFAIGFGLFGGTLFPVLVWLAPLLLVAAPLHALIELPEHVGCRVNDPDPRRSSRTIKAGRIGQWFTNGNNFHVEHHLHAGVQVEHWHRMHDLVRHQIEFLEPSYWAFYRRFFVALRRGVVNDSAYWSRASASVHASADDHEAATAR